MGLYGILAILDEYLYQNPKVTPIDFVLDIMENHLLEDGFKGNSEYQDLLGDAWKILREARKLKVEEE